MSADALRTAGDCAVIWMIIMSALLFMLMGIDKGRARHGGRRISEKRLFAAALMGGAFGGWLGMYVFRHKTRHWYFAWGFPAIALAEAALVWYLKTL